MATVLEHLESIYARLDALDKEIDLLKHCIGDPLQQEIDLDLPHASAGNVAPEGAATGREATVETEVSDDSLTVSLPPASPERQAERLRFAEDVLNLNETFPGLEDEGGLTAAECYAKGGPQWLYLGSKEGRDLIITLPPEWRRAMVEDIAQDSTQAAQEFARDVLKDTDPHGAMESTYDSLLSTEPPV